MSKLLNLVENANNKCIFSKRGEKMPNYEQIYVDIVNDILYNIIQNFRAEQNKTAEKEIHDLIFKEE